MPIGFDGAFQAYSRDMKFPLPGRIHVVMGEPITYEDYESLTDQETTDLLESRIRICFEEARHRWRHSQGA